MAGTEFSTRIDVQPPNPVLLPVIGETVSNRFADGLSSYRNQLERSLGHSSSAATSRQAARQTDRLQSPGGRQQKLSSATTGTTTSARETANKRRSALQTQHRRPAPQTTASSAVSTAAEPTSRPEPTPLRSALSTSRTRSKDDNSLTPDTTATSRADGPATGKTSVAQAAPAETTPAETAAQRTRSTEDTPAEGTPPVNLQLFTVTEVETPPLLAGSRLSGNEIASGASSPSDEESGTTTDLKSNDSPDSNVLIPPLGIFVEPNLTDNVTSGRGEFDTTTDLADQGKTSAENAPSTNGLSVTADNFLPGQAEAMAETPLSQQLVSMPGSADTTITTAPGDVLQQSTPTTPPENEGASLASSASDQATGTLLADSSSAGSANLADDGSSTTNPNDASTTTAVVPSDTAGLRDSANAKSRRRGDDRSQTNGQTDATASARTDNTSGPALQVGQENPAAVTTASPLVSATPSAAEGNPSIAGSPSIDAGGAAAGGHNAPPVANPGTVTASSREIGTTQTANRPQGGQAAELVDRVATAVRSAHQSQRELRIRLTPPELGTVRIEVSSRGGTLTARLEVETAAAQQTIQQNLSLLRDALAQQGTHLQRIDVHLVPNRGEEGQPQSGGQGQQDSQQQQEQQSRQEQQPSRQGSQNSQHSQDEEAPDQSTASRSMDELDIQV